MGFNNPLTGLNGSLIYPQIKSPNYVPGVSGWEIKKDGSAEFNNLVIRGTFFGTDFIISANGVFFYSGVPAAGNLILALAPAAGVDSFGNAYNAGFTAGAAGSAEQIVIGVHAGSPLMFFLSAIATALNNAALMLNLSGAGAATFDTLVIKSSQDTGHVDYSALNLDGNSNDGSHATQLSLAYVDPGLVAHFYEVVNWAGVQISAGRITGIHPGTGGSSASPAVGETWQTPVPSAIWTTVGTTQALRYRFEPQGDQGCVRLDGELITTGAGPWPANATIVMLGVGYRPTANKSFITRSDIALGAGQSVVNVLTSGGVQNGEAFTAAGQRLFFDGILFPLG